MIRTWLHVGMLGCLWINTVCAQPPGSSTISIILIVETAITPDFILRKPRGREQSTSPEPIPSSLQATACVCVCVHAWESVATEENPRGLAEGRKSFFFSTGVQLKAVLWNGSVGWWQQVALRPFPAASVSEQNGYNGIQKLLCSLAWTMKEVARESDRYSTSATHWAGWQDADSTSPVYNNTLQPNPLHYIQRETDVTLSFFLSFAVFSFIYGRDTTGIPLVCHVNSTAS